MRNVRSWAVAVSAILSHASTIVFIAVSTPIDMPVKARSLSIEAGMPITVSGWPPSSSGSVRCSAPVSEPLPPTTSRPSMPCSRSTVRARSRASRWWNSLQRAEPRMVPPSRRMPLTSAGVSGLIAFSSKPR
jgi:hypothetical protein